MTDLSYTDKDGLNPAEGFTNLFNYHKDGKQDGDGFVHGGYPHIDGGTSSYTDTSYRTGDKEDFFDNGNVWVQPPVNPGPVPPTPTGLYATLKPIVCTAGMFGPEPVSLPEAVIEGTYPGIESGENYTITYNGAEYNLTASEFAMETPEGQMSSVYLGNIGAYFHRYEFGAMVKASGGDLPEENDIPFVIVMSGDESTGQVSTTDATVAFISNETGNIFTLTHGSDSCTIQLSLSLSTSQWYIMDESVNDIMEMLNPSVDKQQSIIVNDVTYEGSWKQDEQDETGFDLIINAEGGGIYIGLLIIPVYNFAYFVSREDDDIEKEVKVLPSN